MKFNSIFITLSTFYISHGESSRLTEGECVKNVWQEGVEYTEETITCISETNETETSEASFVDMTYPAPKVEDELGEDMGVPQLMDGRNAKESLERLEAARTYIENVVKVDEKYELTRDICKNKHESCTFWSTIGECDANPGYMKVNCGPVCFSCEVSMLESVLMKDIFHVFV